jgi:uncharacterized protein YfdQ (DUF2303 family)
MDDANITADALHAAIILGQQIANPHLEFTVPYAVVPDGSKVVSLMAYKYPGGITPERIAAHVALADAKSFCEYVKSYADDRTRIFADPATHKFTAIIDYHGAGERKPEFLSHRAALQLTKDERWKIWIGGNEKLFSQSDFAEFLEDNAADISEPEAAVMLEVARDLHAHTDVNFDSKVTPKNGQVQLKYTETINAGVGAGNLEVPEFFKIRIPIFYGEESLTLRARLRFRISGGKLSFQYKLDRPTEKLNDAFNAAVASIAGVMQTEVLLGGMAT